VSEDVCREVIIPELEREINEGKTFARLRQVYNAMLLATWYKHVLKESLLTQIYGNKSKTAGVDTAETDNAQKIYNQYMQALQKGVFNYVKGDNDSLTREFGARKYFAGGLERHAWEKVERLDPQSGSSAIVPVADQADATLVRANLRPYSANIAPVQSAGSAVLDANNDKGTQGESAASAGKRRLYDNPALYKWLNEETSFKLMYYEENFGPQDSSIVKSYAYDPRHWEPLGEGVKKIEVVFHHDVSETEMAAFLLADRELVRLMPAYVWRYLHQLQTGDQTFSSRTREWVIPGSMRVKVDYLEYPLFVQSFIGQAIITVADQQYAISVNRNRNIVVIKKRADDNRWRILISSRMDEKFEIPGTTYKFKIGTVANQNSLFVYPKEISQKDELDVRIELSPMRSMEPAGTKDQGQTQEESSAGSAVEMEANWRVDRNDFTESERASIEKALLLAIAGGNGADQIFNLRAPNQKLLVLRWYGERREGILYQDRLNGPVLSRPVLKSDMAGLKAWAAEQLKSQASDSSAGSAITVFQDIQSLLVTLADKIPQRQDETREAYVDRVGRVKQQVGGAMNFTDLLKLCKTLLDQGAPSNLVKDTSYGIAHVEPLIKSKVRFIRIVQTIQERLGQNERLNTFDFSKIIAEADSITNTNYSYLAYLVTIMHREIQGLDAGLEHLLTMLRSELSSLNPTSFGIADSESEIEESFQRDATAGSSAVGLTDSFWDEGARPTRDILSDSGLKVYYSEKDTEIHFVPSGDNQDRELWVPLKMSEVQVLNVILDKEGDIYKGISEAVWDWDGISAQLDVRLKELEKGTSAGSAVTLRDLPETPVIERVLMGSDSRITAERLEAAWKATVGDEIDLYLDSSRTGPDIELIGKTVVVSTSVNIAALRDFVETDPDLKSLLGEVSADSAASAVSLNDAKTRLLDIIDAVLEEIKALSIIVKVDADYLDNLKKHVSSAEIYTLESVQSLARELHEKLGEYTDVAMIGKMEEQLISFRGRLNQLRREVIGLTAAKRGEIDAVGELEVNYVYAIDDADFSALVRYRPISNYPNSHGKESFTQAQIFIKSGERTIQSLAVELRDKFRLPEISAIRDEFDRLGMTDEAIIAQKAILKHVAEASSSSVDTKPVGGIDFNPVTLELEIKRDGNGVPLPALEQPRELFNIPGLSPVVISITPMNLPLVLGLKEDETTYTMAGIGQGQG
jgi:hypothetical protein